MIILVWSDEQGNITLLHSLLLHNKLPQHTDLKQLLFYDIL